MFIHTANVECGICGGSDLPMERLELEIIGTAYVCVTCADMSLLAIMEVLTEEYKDTVRRSITPHAFL